MLRQPRGKRPVDGVRSVESISGRQHAAAHVTERGIKYSLLLAPDTGFIFVEAEATEETPPRPKPAAQRKNTGRPVGKGGPGDRRRNATAAVLKEGYQDALEAGKKVWER